MGSDTLGIQGILQDIRRRAVSLAAAAWPQLGTAVDAALPLPLHPMALLPIATGRAVGANIQELCTAAAAVVLTDIALRIADDCADQDDPGALYTAIGTGQAVNMSMALNAVAARTFSQLNLPQDKSQKVVGHYFQSFLDVCHGQELDMRATTGTLKEYEETVKLKTIPAYEFAAAIGAYMGTADEDKIGRCITCGAHLGWMAQILDDVESLWFPVSGNDSVKEIFTFPVLWGLSAGRPRSKKLQRLCNTPVPDRSRICGLLDEMDMRGNLFAIALDHRDKAISALSGDFDPAGSALLTFWMNWTFHAASRLLKVGETTS